MKIYIEEGNQKIALKEIESINGSEVLFFLLNMRIRNADRDLIEKELSLKTGKTCVVLDALFEKVLGI